MTDEELLTFYQNRVKLIPELRQLCSYPEEDAVKCLTNLINNHSKDEDFGKLVGSCMKANRGLCNPAVVVKIIQEWKESKYEPND
jgi:hypothetical protein